MEAKEVSVPIRDPKKVAQVCFLEAEAERIKRMSIKLISFISVN